MKKILSAIVLFALVVLPMSVMAMTTISDNELSTVTGQAGVSINVDVTANLTIGTVAWGDSDGFTGYTNAGFVGIEGLNLTVHASGRHDGAFSTGGATAVGYMANDPITIDVGTNDGGQSIVRIGLPTFHITVSTLQTDIFVSGVTAGAPTSTVAQQLGAIYMSGIEIRLGQSATPSDAGSFDAGYVTIGAAGAGNTGVNIGFVVNIDSVEIGTLSYGNTTSLLAGDFGAAATAGYIGVTGLNLDDVNIYGGVAIGVGTLNTAALNAAAANQGVITQVNIVVANGTTVAIPGAITGTVVLAQNQELTTGAGELGNFYIGGVTAQIVDNVGSLSDHSLIQIWAH
ncbi:MAG: hypothetical protein GX642_09870 [Smithella sp.]|nr:hypothetical protein [Smithella sp.]